MYGASLLFRLKLKVYLNLCLVVSPGPHTHAYTHRTLVPSSQHLPRDCSDFHPGPLGRSGTLLSLDIELAASLLDK